MKAISKFLLLTFAFLLVVFSIIEIYLASLALYYSAEPPMGIVLLAQGLAVLIGGLCIAGWFYWNRD